MENINGEPIGHGTIHFEENSMIRAETIMPSQGWHTWRVEIDRQPGNFYEESIAWFVDDVEFHRVYGQRTGETVWIRLAHSPFFFILNMAVGGYWPGYPNKQTMDGYGSMVEYGYIAHYST
ncbi:hypothetical protein S40288_10410 [Stachybotrys chartarum IBT 40288]|nr:hypothetical protein S40288_10410 [Stachybotrys chartarum IBT 40288]